ncbi:MAG: hypothetical protein ABFD90_08945 [Phycisphaerales bacterium]
MILVAQAQNTSYLVQVMPPILGDRPAQLDGQFCKEDSIVAAVYKYGFACEVYYPGVLIAF